MTPLELLRSQAASKRAALQSLTDACTADGETRDLTADEQTRFDGLFAEITALKGRIAAAEAAEIEPAPAPEGRGRQSQPIGQGPAIHTNSNRPYSLMRAIRLAAEGKPLDGPVSYTHLAGSRYEVPLIEQEASWLGSEIAVGDPEESIPVIGVGLPELSKSEAIMAWPRRDAVNVIGIEGGLLRVEQLISRYGEIGISFQFAKYAHNLEDSACGFEQEPIADADFSDVSHRDFEGC